MKLTPRPEQEATILRALAEPTHSVLMASQQDTGKSLMACEIIIRAEFKRVLICGVKDTFSQWAERLSEQGGPEMLRIDATKAGLTNLGKMLAGEDGIFFAGHQFIASKDWGRTPVLGNDGEPKQKTNADGALIFRQIPGTELAEPVYEYKRRHLGTYKKMRPLDALISDETQIHANRKSNGIGTVRSIPTDWKLALSGTPAGNKFENLHTVTRWLWPSALDESGELLIDPSIYRWREQWCSMESKYVGGGRPVSVVLGEKEPGSFVTTLPCYLRLLSPAGEVPEPELIYVDLSPTERAGYDQMEEEGVMWLNAHPGLEPLVAQLPISKRTRLRTAALGVMSFDPDGEVFFAPATESSKMAALRGVLDGPEWAGRQVVIFTHSKTFARMAAARMNRAGYVTGLWTGDVPSKQRDTLKQQFIDGEVTYIFAVIESISRGYDGLQDAANRVVWMSRSDNSEQNGQAARRVFRTGGDLDDYRSVELIARDTYDEGVFNKDRASTDTMNATLAA